MDLIRPLHHHGTCQSGLEDLEGRRHDDIRRQVIPYPDGNWKEAVSKGINTPSWNAKPATMSSCALHVWSEVDWCWYSNLTVDYSVHHDSSDLFPSFLQGAPS